MRGQYAFHYTAACHNLFSSTKNFSLNYSAVTFRRNVTFILAPVIFKKCGSNSTDCQFCLLDFWPNERRDKCIPKSTEYLSYGGPLGVTLTTVITCLTALTLAVLAVFFVHRYTPVVKANNRLLSFLLLWSLAICFLSTLLLIGQPTKLTCMFQQAVFGIIFVLCIACVLAKTVMVIIAFKATFPDSKLKRWVGPKLPMSIVFICTFLQATLCICWITISPPFPERNLKSQAGKIIIQCNQGSNVAFWSMLGFIGLLSLISFIVAFLARNLPDSFNEAKYLTFSMIVCISVWLSFIPAYLSTQGMYMVAVEVFAILSSSTGLLSCIFFPKCYIILMRPYMNSKEYLMGRAAQIT
ncbi:vomeronasal type-2 receptor 26-like [Protopterus annectens]|uniref:vomeronasal type-2 receptor 26-like n=1 Tax=Protopterus annectens TaxID=7888 RepID=UPI001CFA431A|nr:vomeronasal type-2 receptor 26-like [Protopterus annectens]